MTQSFGKVSRIMELFTSLNRPLTVPEIRRELDYEKVSSIINTLWKRGHLLASEIRYILTLDNSNGRWKWSRSRQRWYVLANGDDKVVLPVTYKIFNRKLGKNVDVTENLVFAKYEETSRLSRNKNSIVLRVLKESEVALSSNEVSKITGLSKSQVRTALTDLVKQGKINRSGYFNPRLGRESQFPFGWLYYQTIEQYQRRLEKHDLLTGIKQRMYEHILMNTQVQRRLTPNKEFEEFPFNLNQYVIHEYMTDLLAIYKDVKRIELGSREVFYYIDRVLTDEEIQKQLQYWQNKSSEQRSFKNFLGHAHEQFVQTGLDMMWNQGDLKISDYWWEFSITKDGKKRYNVYKPRVSNPKKQFEFDRVLHCLLSPFTKRKVAREIILVFEMKYRGTLEPIHWYRFIRKLSDTFDFGTKFKTRDSLGREVEVRMPKFNVVPVIVIPWQGKEEIQTKNKKKINFAQMVISQGGIVLFTREFENYIREKVGKPVNFKRIFKKWYEKDEKEAELFTKYLLEYLGFAHLKEVKNGQKTGSLCR
jgi:predicted transcriptional regulator